MSEEIYVSPAELEDFKELFGSLDEGNKGTISVQGFFNFLQANGQNYSEQEENLIRQEVDPSDSGVVTFENFVLIMKKFSSQEETTDEEAVLKAFQTFDPEKKNLIPLKEFKYILCNFGSDRFTEEECDEIFKETDLDNLKDIKYKDLIEYWRNK